MVKKQAPPSGSSSGFVDKVKEYKNPIGIVGLIFALIVLYNLFA